MTERRSSPPSSRRLPADSEPDLTAPRRKSRLSLQIRVEETSSSAPPPPSASGSAIAPMPMIAVGKAPLAPSLPPSSRAKLPKVPAPDDTEVALPPPSSSMGPISTNGPRSVPPRPRAKESLLPALKAPDSEDVPLSVAMPESTNPPAIPSSIAPSVPAPPSFVHSSPPRSVPAAEISTDDLLHVEDVPTRPAAPPPPPVGQKFSRTAEMTSDKTQAVQWWEILFDEDYLATLHPIQSDEVQRECTFIEEALGVEPGGRILDVGAGRGEHAAHLASRGYEVTAIDRSEVMVRAAAERARAQGVHVTVRHEDMRELAEEGSYDGLYCVGGSFGYFSEDENLAVLQKMHRALKPGGQLLIDVPNRDHLAPRLPSTAWFEGDGCVCMDEATMDFLTSRLHVKRTMMFHDGRVREHSYSVRLYAVHELGRALHKHGFRVVEVSGDLPLPGIFFGAESPRVMILAEKKA